MPEQIKQKNNPDQSNDEKKRNQIVELLKSKSDTEAKKGVMVSLGNYILKELIDFNEEKNLAEGADEEYDIETFVLSKIDLINAKINEAYTLLKETHPETVKDLTKEKMLDIILKNFKKLETFNGITDQQRKMIKGLGESLKTGFNNLNKNNTTSN